MQNLFAELEIIKITYNILINKALEKIRLLTKQLIELTKAFKLVWFISISLRLMMWSFFDKKRQFKNLEEN